MSANLNAHAAWIVRDLIGPCVQYRETCTAHGGDVDPGDYEHRCSVARGHAATVVERLRQVMGGGENTAERPRLRRRYAVMRVADGRVSIDTSREEATRGAALSEALGEGEHVVVTREVWEGPWVPLRSTS